MKRAIRLEIKVAPGASKNALQGFVGDVLKLAVTAQPERGKANKAAVALLAKHLEVAPSALCIVRGATGPRKTVAIEGLAPEAVNARLRAAVP